jgi:hypothetical protein
MRRLIAISCLTIFLAFFLIASVDYFRNGLTVKTIALGGLAGVALAQFLFEFSIIQIKRRAIRNILGVLTGVVLFSGVFFAEHVMSTIQLSRAMRDPESFAVVSGHCGVYSGRGLIRWYQLSWKPVIENKMAAFLFSNQCRIDHFLDLRKRAQLPCAQDEDALSCLNRWMTTFSKRGFWNYPTRKMFYAEAQSGVINGQDAEVDKKWIKYALQDYELEQSHPTLIQQAGVEEDFNDIHHFFKVRDEHQNLVLTKEIFEHAAQAIKDDKTPEAQRFKEVRKEVNLKLEKLPELEEDLKNAQAKVSYNPSL